MVWSLSANWLKYSGCRRVTSLNSKRKCRGEGRRMLPRDSSSFLKCFLGTPESFLFSVWKFPTHKTGNFPIQLRANTGKYEFPPWETRGVCVLERKLSISSLFPGKEPA